MLKIDQIKLIKRKFVEGRSKEKSKEMELRSGQEGIHRGFNNLSHSGPSEGSSKLSAAASISIATRVTDDDKGRNHGGTALNPPQQTLDPHLPPHLLLHSHSSNHLPQQQQQQTHVHQQMTSPNPDLVPTLPPVLQPAAASDSSDSKLGPPPPQPQATSLAPTTTTTTAAAVVQYYRECLKNHAASTGGHVVDGCGEFMPGGEGNTPEALRCAACDCHRNFHRRELLLLGGEQEDNSNNTTPQIQSPQAHINSSVYPCSNVPYNRVRDYSTTNSHKITTINHHPPPSRQHQQHHNAASRCPIPPPVMMAFHGGAAAESSSEDLNQLLFHYNNNIIINPPGGTTITAKKRYRTKFSQAQKDRMQEFAERLGWKMHKQDDQLVEQFCEEAGVKRQVFKVWMHNNKAAAIKKNKH